MSIVTYAICHFVQLVMPIASVFISIMHQTTLLLIRPMLEAITFGSISSSLPYCDPFYPFNLTCQLNCIGPLSSNEKGLYLCGVCIYTFGVKVVTFIWVTTFVIYMGFETGIRIIMFMKSGGNNAPG